MRLEGTYTFAAPRAAVWEALMDPDVIGNALPGGEKLEQLGENEYKAFMNVKVGPVQGKFEGKVALDRIVPLEGYTMRVEGQGAPGFVSGEGALALEDSDGGTLLRYAGDVQVGGRIAGVGQRLIESTAKSITRQGLTSLDQMVQARIAPPVVEIAAPPAMEAPATVTEAAGASRTAPTQVQPAPPRAAAAAQGPSMAEVASQVVRDVAKDVAGDYIPADKQERVLYFGLGVLAMLLFVVLVRLVQKD
jgi:uncharacterized protein